jgi:hypothetical protein
MTSLNGCKVEGDFPARRRTKVAWQTAGYQYGGIVKRVATAGREISGVARRRD